MPITILDCYTDEPAGLGVPPYLGTYPRYLYGYFKQNFDEKVYYLTIDDLRFFKRFKLKEKRTKISDKTNITIYNLTKNINHIEEILKNTSKLFIIIGVHAPGKYLSAIPGTLREVKKLLEGFRFEKVITGPAIFGTQLEGGKFFEKQELKRFEKKGFNFSYDDIRDYSVVGTEIVDQIEDLRIVEIEASKGCNSGKCSFCTEPLKNKFEIRNKEDILKEIKTFYDKGIKYFRLGKQSDFYSIDDPIWLLKNIRKECKDIKVLHIDNVNPLFVPTKKGIEITKAIVKYCTSGNVAALGIESFDPEVIKSNYLNCSPEKALEAIRIINKYGKERGVNGMPKFLPGLNLIFGLKNESKQTHEWNMKYLKKILDENLLLRRINIRQVAIFEGTPLFKECGNKFLRKNRKYYWKWRDEIRKKIDNEMLKRLISKGTVLSDLWTEIYDGKRTFGRQIGTYPLVVGIEGRLPLKNFIKASIEGYMLRGVTGKLI